MRARASHLDQPEHGRSGSSVLARQVVVSLRAVLLMGPTAAGKTDVALELAAELPCEIISVDSALVFRGMDIGSGKPSRTVLERFPHHLVDIIDPRDRYSAGQFVRDVSRLIP